MCPCPCLRPVPLRPFLYSLIRYVYDPLLVRSFSLLVHVSGTPYNRPGGPPVTPTSSHSRPPTLPSSLSSTPSSPLRKRKRSLTLPPVPSHDPSVHGTGPKRNPPVEVWWWWRGSDLSRPRPFVGGRYARERKRRPHYWSAASSSTE